MSNSINSGPRKPLWAGRDLPFGRQFFPVVGPVFPVEAKISYCKHLSYKQGLADVFRNFDLSSVFLYHTIWNAIFHRNDARAVDAGAMTTSAQDTPPDNRASPCGVFIPAKQKEYRRVQATFRERRHRPSGPVPAGL